MAGPLRRMLGRRRLAEGVFLRFSRTHYLGPDGRGLARDLVEHPGAVAVVPLFEGDVLLIRQYRSAVDSDLLEIPAGKLDVAGEDREETARRECEEEVGHRPGKLTYLHHFYTSPGFTDELIWLYEAEQLRPVGPRPTGAEEEAAEIVQLSLDEAIAMVERGTIRDAKTIIGLYAVAARRSSR